MVVKVPSLLKGQQCSSQQAPALAGSGRSGGNKGTSLGFEWDPGLLSTKGGSLPQMMASLGKLLDGFFEQISQGGHHLW